MNDKSFETSNFYSLPKNQKSKVIEATIHSHNTEVVEVRELRNLKLRPIVGGQIFQPEDLVIFWVLF